MQAKGTPVERKYTLTKIAPGDWLLTGAVREGSDWPGREADMPYSDQSAGSTSVDLARAMHAESVDLWNRLWDEAGAAPDFPQREDMERVQEILARLAWPTPAETHEGESGT